MAKKKKPTLKSNLDRGFATTSTPKKAQEPSPPEPSKAATPSSNHATPTSEQTATSLSDKTSLNANINAYSNVGSKDESDRFFNPEDEEEQALQNLVDRLQERVEKEISRAYKAIEFDRRLSKTLPVFEIDPEIRDQILSLASAIQLNQSQNLQVSGTSGARATESETTPTSSQMPSALATPSLPGATPPDGMLTPATSAHLSASGTLTPLSLALGLSSMGFSSAPPSTAFVDSEDKVLIRSLTTYSLLLKLGFQPHQAETAIANAPSPDLEECLAHLFLTLDQESLEDAMRIGEGKGAKRRRGKEEDASRITAELEKEEDEVDESRPPKHEGYEFERKEAVGRTQFSGGMLESFASKMTAGTSSAGTTLPGQGGPCAPNGKGVKAQDIKEISEETLKEIKTSASRFIDEISDLLEDQGKINTLEKPTGSWSLLRACQIQTDQEKARWKKAAGKDSKAFSSEEARMERVVGRSKDLMRECERTPGFDARSANEGFRDLLKKREEEDRVRKEMEEEEARQREQRRKEIEGITNGGSEEGERAIDQSEQLGSLVTRNGGEPKPDPISGSSRSQVDENVSDREAGQRTADDAASDSESEGGLFGDLLEEDPTSTTDAETGEIVNLKALPVQAKGGSGGKTPRVLLSDALKRADAYAAFRFEHIPSGGRIFRSKLTIRWNGGKVVPTRKGSSGPSPTYVDEYKLTTLGCSTQNQADDLIATVALNSIEKDKPAQRSLPPGFREWWDELEALRKVEKSAKDRDRVSRIRELVRVRMNDSASLKKTKAKANSSSTGDQAKNDLGALATASGPSLSEEKASETAEWFANRVSSAAYQKMLIQRQTLPIAKYRDHILEIMDNNQIFVLSGETGCGKSTQVPAYILEHCLSNGKPCKIYVTEPRRISAISLAERVSEELGESRGSVGKGESLVGYAIRLESHVGRNAKLVYATTGIVLRMLEGTAFNDITHVIIDEVHERSIESDFLLIILKTLIEHRKDLKFILMSATVDAERISAYCGGCPTVSVPGRTFPVDVRYLEDAVEICDYTLQDDSPYVRRPKRGYNGRKADAPGNKAKLQSTEDEDVPPEDDDDDQEEGPEAGSLQKSGGNRYRPKTINTIERMDEYSINHELIVKILERVCFESDLVHYSAATLIFLPGLADIRKCHDLLSDHKIFGGPSFRLYPLHSTISSENQSAVFEVPPPGIRKVVIATNIAETGITIPDITCVIDSGKHREMRFDEKRQISRLVECFVAKSNAKQRRGRAGRVQEGLCFHLFTKVRHDSYFADHPLPEMLRLSLQDLALKLKIMKIRIGTSIEDALSQALDPPTPVNIQRAVSALVEVKALTANEEITPMGKHLSRLPLDVHMAKFLLVATLFKCLDPALTIAAALNSKSPFLTPFGKESEAERAKQSFKVGDSDFLTIANAFNGWRRSVALNHHRIFCNKSFLSPQNLGQIEELRQQYLSYLVDSGFIAVDEETKNELSKARYRPVSGGSSSAKPRFVNVPKELDVNSNSIAVINSAIVAGLYPKILELDQRSNQLKTLGNNQPASIHPSSVNFRITRSPDLPKGLNLLVYFTIMQSRKLYAWETGLVDIKPLLLLCGDADFKLSSSSIYLDRQKLRLQVPDPKTLLALKLLRENVNKCLNSSYRYPSRAWNPDQIALVQLGFKFLGMGLNEKDKVFDGR
ncbi:putative DNA/RNA helicase [Violaceomyces palustris]|uniref:DNA/RNA helicase n=1 Tax=Violaceomyces palustris TaxID=1673888 RepID=A0ACD0NTS1_9BASI|nr:putative DNA/RNA helicase [Violaceomyces palustris]